MIEWLDARVDIYKRDKETANFNNQISAINVTSYVQISSGINLIADIIGVKLKLEKLKNVTYKYRYSFVYKEIEFAQVSNVPLEV